MVEGKPSPHFPPRLAFQCGNEAIDGALLRGVEFYKARAKKCLVVAFNIDHVAGFQGADKFFSVGEADFTFGNQLSRVRCAWNSAGEFYAHAAGGNIVKIAFGVITGREHQDHRDGA